MDIRSELSRLVAEAILACFGDAVSSEDASAAAIVETPRDVAHGDLATTAAMRLAKPLRKPPKQIADELVEALEAACEASMPGYVEEIEVVAPGFINFHLGMPFFCSVLADVPKGGYGHGAAKRVRVNLEYVSTNPTGPLTVPHGRQAAVGDALANILEYAGYDVSREYYLNDTGRQIRLLGGSVLHYYAKLADSSHPFPEDGYRGDYVPEIAKDLFDEEGAALVDLDDDEAVRKAGQFAMDLIVEEFKRDFENFRVRFDVFFSQKSIEESGAVDELMERLRAAGLVYDKDGAVWMKLEQFGDQKDRVVVKSDGAYTYRTPDIAYHENKFGRKFDVLIDLLGPDHHGHIIAMQAAMRATGHPLDAFRAVIVQFCTLWRGGEKLKMSTRAGHFVTLREVMDEVGVDATRYFFTALKTDSPLDFDLDFAKSRSMENPVYYIQYMSARLSGVMETAAADERFAPDMTDGLFLPENVDLSPLGDEEGPILRALVALPAVIEKAADNLEPHRLCWFLHGLAGLFHNYYAKNRFISEDIDLTRARLYYAACLKVLLAEMLALIGVAAPDKM